MSKDIKPDLRAVVVKLASTTPGTDGPGVAWVAVPGGHGWLPAFGDPETMLHGWRLGDSAFTVDDLHAAADVLVANGLGWVAVLNWRTQACGGGAVAWGPTSRKAVDQLVGGLRALWPRVAGLSSATFAGAWEPGERRAVAGPSVTVSAPRPYRDRAALEAEHGDLRVAMAPVQHGWRAALAEGIATNPVAWAVSLDASYAGRQRRGPFLWEPRKHGGTVRGAVTRAEAFPLEESGGGRLVRGRGRS